MNVAFRSRESSVEVADPARVQIQRTGGTPVHPLLARERKATILGHLWALELLQPDQSNIGSLYLGTRSSYYLSN